jgi:hypothetical protein
MQKLRAKVKKKDEQCVRSVDGAVTKMTEGRR